VIEESAEGIEIKLTGEALTKQLRFAADGALTVSYTWTASLAEPEDRFSTELSLFAPLQMRFEPQPEVWTFPIETVAKSERGLDRTRQGDSVTLRWPVRLGAATVELQGALEPATAGRATDLS
jgi:hypothetical protein